ncbi:hypothetical protein M569_06986, partial [Genlisea aurea]
KPLDHCYISKILLSEDWYLLLRHEFNETKGISLSAQVAVSILQKLENCLGHLRFYIWISNTCAPISKNQSVRAALCDALFRKGPILLSAELIRDIKKSGCRLNEELICALIDSWGRLGLTKYCSDVFDQLAYLGILPTTRLYNALINALVKSDSLDLAYLKFQQMEVDNCARDRFTYNILIHGVCKANVLDEALRLVKQMEGSGYSPNVFTYTILIDGYCSSKRVDGAFVLLETMKKRNIRPNDATYRSLINGVFRSLPPEKAFESLFSWISREKDLPRVVHDSIIYNLCDHSLPKHVITVLRAALRAGYVPDSSVSTMALTCLLKGLDLEETCWMFECLTNHGAKVDLSTCLALIEALYRSRYEKKGDLYLSWVLKDGLISSVFSYNMLADCFCKAKMMSRALKLLEVMCRSRASFPNLVTFNTVLFGFCKCRDETKARETLLMLLKHGFKPDVFTFSSIIDLLCRIPRMDDAFSCFVEMAEWEVPPNAVVYNTLIRALCTSGTVARAVKLFRKMKDDGIPPDVYTFNALIQRYCKANRIKEAQRLLSSMLTMGVSPDNFTYIAFINSFCESGRLAEAKELLFSMELNGCRPDLLTCHSVVDAFVKAGGIQEAQDI